MQGVTPGNVVFKLRERQGHPRFRREGNDLHHTMHISLKEALLGFRKSILHLDGREVRTRAALYCAVDMRVRACVAFSRFCRLVVLIPARRCVAAVQVPVESTTVTKPFEVRQIEGEGMPFHNFPSQKGILHVKFEVDFPQSLSKAQKDLVEKLFTS